MKTYSNVSNMNMMMMCMLNSMCTVVMSSNVRDKIVLSI